jgi:hypothetical protein
MATKQPRKSPAKTAVKKQTVASAAVLSAGTLGIARARKPRAKPSSPTTVQTSCLEQRLQMISEAAYYLAERRGFASGGELDDWITAEAQIDEILAGRTV